MKDGAALLDWESLTDRQKVNLSYWIYQHNLENRLLDELSNQVLQDPGGFARWMDDHRERVLKLNKAWVEGHRNWEPSTSDCLLTYLRELIRNADAGQPQPNKDLLKAAGGCRKDYDLLELERHTVDQGWTGSNKPGSEGTSPYFINLPARLYVDERLGELGPERQGFVAMWFDESMDDAYKCGIKLAIQDTGYKPRLIKEKEYLGGVVDEIMAEIRKSRFVVADFTSSTKAGARGGVYFEAGFAYGLDIPVFLTCRKGCKEGVHFDIGHLNRLEWETPEDLRKQLKNSIEAILGRGPRSARWSTHRQPAA
ncbi:MAG: hypothetical protein F4Z18_04435 [Caldilineaceae bacterium SB0666_bin_21]|nr:hypothetical protein [Caldilineaceae bacterium SB0666_bin_21]